jgi:hypothetical protein
VTVRRDYLDFDPARGYPAGAAIAYECRLCGATLPSLPAPPEGECGCGNVGVDLDAGRVRVGVAGTLRAFEKS